MAQFNAGQPWTVVKRAKIEGGHYVSGVARRGGNLIVVTWGREQVVDAATGFRRQGFANPARASAC